MRCVELQGKERVKRWQAMARAGQWAEVFAELMREHYDPLYERSMQPQLRGPGQRARSIELADGEPAALAEAARELLAQ